MQGCQIFLFTIYQNGLYTYTRVPLYYHVTIKYNKWPYNVPNAHNNILKCSISRPPKIYPNCYFFGLKIYHLATLELSSTWLAIFSISSQNFRVWQRRIEALSVSLIIRVTRSCQFSPIVRLPTLSIKEVAKMFGLVSSAVKINVF
jgi:hypothetical protein